MKNRVMKQSVVVCLFVVGCGGLDDALRARAANDLGCPPEGLQSDSVGSDQERVSCGDKAQIYYRNSDEEGWVSPLDRAEVELECPKKDLQTKVLDNKTVAVTGCEKKAIYVLESELTKTGPFSAGMVHKWVRNDK